MTGLARDQARPPADAPPGGADAVLLSGRQHPRTAARPRRAIEQTDPRSALLGIGRPPPCRGTSARAGTFVGRRVGDWRASPEATGDLVRDLCGIPGGRMTSRKAAISGDVLRALTRVLVMFRRRKRTPVSAPRRSSTGRRVG